MRSTARSQKPEVDESILFLSISMMESVNEAILSVSFYILVDEWADLDKFSERFPLPLLSATLQASVPKALSVVQPRLTQVEVTVIDNDWSVVIDWTRSQR